MAKDKHGTQVNEGDVLRFNDGTLERVVDYFGTLYIEDDFDVWPLTKFDSRDYEIVEEGDENEDEIY